MEINTRFSLGDKVVITEEDDLQNFYIYKVTGVHFNLFQPDPDIKKYRSCVTYDIRPISADDHLIHPQVPENELSLADPDEIFAYFDQMAAKLKARVLEAIKDE